MSSPLLKKKKQFLLAWKYCFLIMVTAVDGRSTKVWVYITKLKKTKTAEVIYNTIQYNLFYVGNVGGGYPIPRA